MDPVRGTCLCQADPVVDDEKGAVKIAEISELTSPGEKFAVDGCLVPQLYCTDTRIKRLPHRLRDTPASGKARVGHEVEPEKIRCLQQSSSARASLATIPESSPASASRKYGTNVPGPVAAAAAASPAMP